MSLLLKSPFFQKKIRLVSAPVEKKTVMCFKYRPYIGVLYVRKCLETTEIGDIGWSNICHYLTVLAVLAMPTVTPYLPEFSHEIKQIVLVSIHYAVKAYNQSRHVCQNISLQKLTAQFLVLYLILFHIFTHSVPAGRSYHTSFT